MAECYGFPILSVDECVTFFREVSNTPISEEDFKKPDPRRWQVFYGTIFELMTGREADLTTQSLQTRLQAASDCEDIELKEESFNLMSSIMALQQTLSAAGIMDFNVRDFQEPRRNRLLRIVSGAINFIRFRIFREEVFNKEKEDHEKKRESYDYVLKENAEQKKTFQAKREALDSHMMKMTQLQEESDAISIRIQEQHKQREVLQRNLSEMKNQLSQINAANDQVKVNILSNQADGEKLSQRIVQSPERVRAEQDRAQNRIMALRTKAEEKHGRLQEAQRQNEVAVIKQQNADKSVRLLRDISNDSDRIGELEKEKQGRKDFNQDLQSSSLGLTAKVENLRQSQAMVQEKLSKLDLQYHNKKASLQDYVSQLSQLKETLHDPRSSNESKKCELMKERDGIMGEIRKKEEETASKIDRTNNLYFEILQQVDAMNIEVANGFSQIRTAVKN